MTDVARGGPSMPPRIERINPIGFTLAVAAAAFVLWSLTAAGPSLDQLARGLPNIGNILSRMMPPDLSRIDRILAALFQTFQMAVAGAPSGSSSPFRSAFSPPMACRLIPRSARPRDR